MKNQIITNIMLNAAIGFSIHRGATHQLINYLNSPNAEAPFSYHFLNAGGAEVSYYMEETRSLVVLDKPRELGCPYFFQMKSLIDNEHKLTSIRTGESLHE